MTTQLNENAAKRATVAMLRALGATEIMIRTATASGADQRGLGLQQFEVTEVRLSPALVKRTGSNPSRFEILLPACEVEAKLGVDDSGVGDMFTSLVGICWGDLLLRVTGVTAELFAGCAYLYRISAEA